MLVKNPNPNVSGLYTDFDEAVADAQALARKHYRRGDISVQIGREGQLITVTPERWRVPAAR